MRRSKPALPDWHLWTDVTRTVSPLRRRPLLAQIAAEPLPLPLPLPLLMASPGPPKSLTPPKTAASYQSSGARKKNPPADAGRPIEPRMKRRLGRGQIDIDGTIDLHGMRQEEARTALNRFVTARSARGDRTILVITGKGLKKLGPDAAVIVEAGVLRAMLPVWLSEPRLAPLVAGWDLAAQQHGGEGAYYVRLKRVAA